ncbi:MAG: sigma-E processing peptidase SpoIIGA [Lachnospiraceae bacterium]|nr:sigma-E processing peptidase SpoIIGA [Lachnospiraceae bacterium]
MYYEVYLDVIFLMNLMLDITALRLTGSILRKRTSILRCLFAGVISSATLCILCVCNEQLVLKYRFFSTVIVNALTLFVVFYKKGKGIKEYICSMLIFYFVSFVIGGMTDAFCIGARVEWWKVLVTATLASCFVEKFIMLIIDKKRREGSFLCEVTLYYRGESVSINGLYDTGNHLIEPISGKEVHVAELSAVSNFLPKAFVKAVNDYYKTGTVNEGLYLLSGIRMVPYHAIGTAEGKLLVTFTADKMRIKNDIREIELVKPCIALYEGFLTTESGSTENSYKMILHIVD